MSSATQPSEPGAVRRRAAVLAVLVCVALAPLLPAVVRGEIPFFWDIADHWFPHRLAAHRARAGGELAHWFPHTFCGLPLDGQFDAGGLLYPVHWLTDCFHPAVTLLPQLAFHRLLLALLGYLAGRAWGMGRLSAVLTGCLLLTAGTTVSGQSQPAVLRTLSWVAVFPLALGLLGRGRRAEAAAWFAGGGAVGFVAGYPAFVLILAFTIPPLLLLDPGLPRSRAAWRVRLARVPWVVVGGLVAVLLALPQLLTATALVGESQRAFGLTPEFVNGFHATAAELTLILLPRFDVDGGVARAGFAYVGAGAVALGTLAVLRCRRGAVAFGLVALFGLSASLGRETPLGAVVWSLPGLEFFRNPCQYLLLWTVGVAFSAGLGLEALRERRPALRELGIMLGLPVAWIVLSCVVHGAPEGATLRRLAVTLVPLGVIAVAGGWRRWGRLAVVVVCLLDPLSLRLDFLSQPDRTVEPSAARAAEPVFARVRAHHDRERAAQPARVITSDTRFNWDNRVVTAGLDNVRGLSSLVPYRTIDVSRIIQEGEPFPRVPLDRPFYDYGPTKALDSPLLDLLALRYAVGFRKAPAETGWRRIGPEEWERDAVDPVRFVPRVIEVEPDGEGWRHFVEPGFDPVTTVVVETAEPLGLGSGDAVGEVLDYERGPNDLRLRVRTAEAALLLRSDTHSAGWTVTIDDRPAELLRANHAFQAVVVPAGEHAVVFRYEPPGRRTGLLVAGVGLLLFGGLVLLAIRERRRPSEPDAGATDRA